MYGIIYKITNKINGKLYIGQTVETAEQRLNEHIDSAFNRNAQFALSKALRKYGRDNFYTVQIDTAENKEELNAKEIYWIKYYDSFNNGYNMTTGGEGGDTYAKRTPEQMEITRAKIAKKAHEHNSNHGQYVGKKNPMYGKHHTAEAKAKIGEYSRTHNHMKDPDVAAKVSKALKGKKKDYIPAVVKLYVVNTLTSDYEYISAKEVVEKYHVENYKKLKLLVDNKELLNNIYFISKSVSTIPDECKGVGSEISTESKRTTTEK